MDAVLTWLGSLLVSIISGPLTNFLNDLIKNHQISTQVEATTASNNTLIQQVSQLQSDVNKLQGGNTQAIENDLKAIATADNS